MAILDSSAQPNLWLEALAPRHATEAATLHRAAQPGAFLTNLGLPALTLVYEELPLCRGGFGFVVLNAGLGEKVCVAGFLSATTDLGELYRRVATRRTLSFGAHALQAVARHPAMIGQAAQMVLYPFTSTHSGGEAATELLSIMVDAHYRGSGVGSALMGTFVAECRRRGQRAIEVTVASENEGARRFYASHGFIWQNEFALNGRLMCQYLRTLVPASEDGDAQNSDAQDRGAKDSDTHDSRGQGGES